MKVSIVTVCFNSGKTILETIVSVNKQSYRDIEHIFIDGISTDNTLSIIEDYSLRSPLVVSERDLGIYDAMNKGILKASGDLVFVLNSDDILFCNETVSLVVESFMSNPSVDIIYGSILLAKNGDMRSYIRFWHVKDYYDNAFHSGWHPAHPGFVVKRKVYEVFGLFNLLYKYSADFELMYRFMHVHGVRSMPFKGYIAVQRYGGASTSILGIVSSFFELKSIFKYHGVTISFFFFFKRYLFKLLQFLSSSRFFIC
jgi:glycosyltransferase involved in cell wall biosynthesis